MFMRKFALLALVLLPLLAAVGTEAQETYFGKNKVRYKDFDWKYIQTRHFDIYFYEEAYPTAKFTAAVLESAYTEITSELNYLIQRRVPVFVYNSHNDFQQTNIISSLIPEGVGGFTEAFKNRIVIPFTGSYEDFRHVLHHELTHAVVYDLIYGNAFTSLLTRQRLFSLPLWYAEGFAEYSSRHGWDYWADMVVRDATINGYLTPPKYVGGYLAYKQGQAMVKYIADNYGEDKLGEILRKGKVYLTMNKALKETLGIDEEKFWKEFSKEMKRRYWPEIAVRKEADEIATQLTRAREDGSYFNEEPTWSPEEDKIAIFTDKSDYTEIVLISSADGRFIKSLVEAERSGDLESLHSYVSGMSFSPDGTRLAFIAKSGGSDALIAVDVRSGDTKIKKILPYYNALSPAWSPDGTKIAFSALKNHKRDLFVYYLETEEIEQLTSDRYDDVDPTWMAGSDELVFSSDRPHPQTPEVEAEKQLYVAPGAFMPGDFQYGYYNLFRVPLHKPAVSPLDVGPGQNKSPDVSPDGKKVAFISNRNGIDNLYILDLETNKNFAVTDILSGIRSVSWAPDGNRIAFSAFHRGGFDIFVLKELVPVGDHGVLTLTDYIKGEYDLLQKDKAGRTLAAHRRDSTTTTAEATDTTETDTAAATVATEEPPSGDTTAAIAAAEDSADSDTSAVVVADSTVVTPDTGADAAAARDTTLAAAPADTVDTPADTLGGEPADSAVTPADTLAARPGEDTTATDDDAVIEKTGVYDGEFVFVSTGEKDPLDAVLEDIPDDSASMTTGMSEPASFDSVPPPLPSGEYEVKDYETKFTPDFVGGGVSYDTFFGLRGQSYFVFSDYLGNHQIYVATDLVNTIDQSYIQALYFNNRHRTRLGAGLFHSKNFYLDSDDHLFSDRFYGVQLFASRPFSTFSRVQLSLSQYFIDREYHDFDDLRENRSSKVTTAELAYVTDNVIWGITGPVNGRRAKVTLSTGINLFDAGDINFQAAEFDYRKYWHFKKRFSMALRFSGGASFGDTPKQYFLGGTSYWIGNRTLDAEVYEVENLYFADVVTPLRGIEYYGLSGNRYGLVNWEFRFPMIDYFIMRFPLPIAIANVQGAIFTDIGSAWTDNNFKFGTSKDGSSRLLDVRTGFGFGMRANLGFMVLRYDLAWTTDFNTVSDKPTYYFSFGADF